MDNKTNATLLIKNDLLQAFCIAVVIVAVFSGCAKNRIGLQPVDEDEWFAQEYRSALTSETPSEFTLRFLRQQDLWSLYDNDPIAVLTSLESEFPLRPDRVRLFALTELYYAEATKTDPVTEESAGLYFSCMWHAYNYLFDRKVKPPLNTYSPHFRWACDFYNRSLSKILVHYDKQDIRFKQNVVLPMFNRELLLKGVRSELPWSLKELNQFHVTYNYRVTGLKNHYSTRGLGVPLILDRELQLTGNKAVREPFLSLNHQVCAGTALLHFEESEVELDEAGYKINAYLSVYDPMKTHEIRMKNRVVPLETDFTTPIAYLLNQIPSIKGTTGFFKPEAWTDICGLYMIEPYDPDKIPVVFVHGLFTTTLTWSVMLNELAGDPLIREKYQAWYFLYPTGNPIAFSATLLRDTLKQVREFLDPTGKDAALDRMVLVGHSMGGLLTKMAVQHSKDIVYDALFDKPIEELEIRHEDRDILTKLVFFEPLPFVKRVIFMATPHRGSELSKSKLAGLGLSFVRLPGETVEFVKGITPFFKSELETHANYPERSIPTGFHGLRPDSVISKTIADLPIDSDVIYHSIIGKNASAGTPGGTDGVVAYESAHLEGAATEKIVNSDHNVHVNPAAILEVIRILGEHAINGSI